MYILNIGYFHHKMSVLCLVEGGIKLKKAFMIIGGMFATFIAIVVIALIVDISNDVEYKIVEEDVTGYVS